MRKQLLYCVLVILPALVLIVVLVRQSPAYAGPATTRQVNCATGSDTGNDCTGSPCRTIQHAIDQSSPGDVVMVADGFCPEHITMRDGVSVHGRGWNDTIIDGGHTGPTPTVYMLNGNCSRPSPKWPYGQTRPLGKCQMTLKTRPNDNRPRVQSGVCCSTIHV